MVEIQPHFPLKPSHQSDVYNIGDVYNIEVTVISVGSRSKPNAILSAT
jgi:hypothetical protein